MQSKSFTNLMFAEISGIFLGIILGFIFYPSKSILQESTSYRTSLMFFTTIILGCLVSSCILIYKDKSIKSKVFTAQSNTLKDIFTSSSMALTGLVIGYLLTPKISILNGRLPLESFFDTSVNSLSLPTDLIGTFPREVLIIMLLWTAIGSIFGYILSRKFDRPFGFLLILWTAFMEVLSFLLLLWKRFSYHFRFLTIIREKINQKVSFLLNLILFKFRFLTLSITSCILLFLYISSRNSTPNEIMNGSVLCISFVTFGLLSTMAIDNTENIDLTSKRILDKYILKHRFLDYINPKILWITLEFTDIKISFEDVVSIFFLLFLSSIIPSVILMLIFKLSYIACIVFFIHLTFLYYSFCAVKYQLN